MLAKVLPVILALTGLGAGIGAGIALRPAPKETAHADTELANPCGDVTAPEVHAKTKPDAEGKDQTHDYVKLNNQFVVPVVKDGRVGSLVVMSLSLEIPSGGSEAIYDREPKLRDAFLQVMFDHANTGGFEGAFTNSTKMTVLRTALREIAQKTLGPGISDVLIVDVMRQDT